MQDEISDFDHRSKQATLEFTRAEIICGVGIVLFCISLAIPAIKHGKDALGIECLFMSLFSLFGPAKSPLGMERQMMSIVSHIMHGVALVTVIMTMNRKTIPAMWKWISTVGTVFCVVYLLSVPYSSIEAVYAGFYVWLLSMLIIASSTLFPTPLVDQ